MQSALVEGLKPDPSVKERDTQDGTVLLHPKTGMMFPLDPVGALIWKGIKDGVKVGEISQQIATTCDVPREQVLRDVQDFVQELRQQQLLVSSEPALPPRTWLERLRGKWWRRSPNASQNGQ